MSLPRGFVNRYCVEKELSTFVIVVVMSKSSLLKAGTVTLVAIKLHRYRFLLGSLPSSRHSRSKRIVYLSQKVFGLIPIGSQSLVYCFELLDPELVVVEKVYFGVGTTI